MTPDNLDCTSEVLLFTPTCSIHKTYANQFQGTYHGIPTKKNLNRRSLPVTYSLWETYYVWNRCIQKVQHVIWQNLNVHANNKLQDAPEGISEYLNTIAIRNGDAHHKLKGQKQIGREIRIPALKSFATDRDGSRG